MDGPSTISSRKRRRSPIIDGSDSEEDEFLKKLDRLGNDIKNELAEWKRHEGVLHQYQQRIEDLKSEYKTARPQHSSATRKSIQDVRNRFVAVKTVSPLHQTRPSNRESTLPTPAPEISASGCRFHLNSIPIIAPADIEPSPDSPLRDRGRHSFNSTSTLGNEPDVPDESQYGDDGALRRQSFSQVQSSATLTQESQQQSRPPSAGRAGPVRGQGRGRPSRGRLSRGGLSPAGPPMEPVPEPSQKKARNSPEPILLRLRVRTEPKNYAIGPTVDDAQRLTASQEVQTAEERLRLTKLLKSEGSNDPDYTESQERGASVDGAIDDEEGEESSDNDNPLPTKRGPGRPRKNSIKRGPGRPRGSKSRRRSSGGSATATRTAVHATTGRGSHPPLSQDPAAFAELKRNFSETPKFGKNQKSLDGWCQSPPLDVPGLSR